MAKSIRLVIPDSGVLISFAESDLLDLLTVFHPHVDLVITDVVEYEVTHRIDIENAQRIRAFLSKNEGRIQVDTTSFASQLKLIREGAKFDLPNDAGEMSIYSYVNTTRKSNPGEATLILFEDDWFIENAVRPGNVHLLSTRAFLDGLEALEPKFSSAAALREILKRRPTVQAAKVDEVASKVADGSEWATAVNVAAAAKVGRRLR